MWMLLVVLALGTGQGQNPGQADPARLVEQLGSPRFQEREDAAEGLRKLGGAALPALRTAMQNDDMERKSRATALVAEIEARLMVEPTLVKLAYRDRPLLEVVADLGNQSETSISLFPDNAPAWADRRITLEAAEPVPFWEAIEHLCREAGLAVTNGQFATPMGPNPNPAVRRRLRTASLQLVQSTTLPGPSGVNGPFRAIVTSIQQHRERSFITGIGIGPQGMALQGQGPRIIRPVQPQAPAAPAPATGASVPGVTSESFVVTVQINAEPRLAILNNGPLRVLEAVDELGQSLAPGADPAAANGANRFAGGIGFNGMGGGPAIQFPVVLTLPQAPGKFVKRLKLAVPLVVTSRRSDPYVIPLAEAKGKTFESPDMIVQIHEIKNEPNQQFTTIELTVKMRRDDSANNPNQGQFGQEFMAFRANPGQSQNQVEIVDAQGKLFAQWFPINQQPGNDGLRMSVRLMPTEGVGAPAEIRLYELGRAETETQVELHDIPMP